eukprot:TRINITY_DN3257_c0_g1_i1.p1 TRINITY_DN3257_c0_g1~~TRINITY_DN3257_c0_g1_i1.p1  ORF type:complete len:661 (-),score=107.74 TRINITY_DN3257_c0_g1_i1:73-2055(-)
MGGASSYIAMLCIAGFLGGTWMATKISKALGVSDIVLVITTGVVLGPGILGLVSEEYTECEQTRHVKCHDPDLAMKLAKGEEIGPALGRIAGMDYCHKGDYQGSHGSSSASHGSSHSSSTVESQGSSTGESQGSSTGESQGSSTGESQGSSTGVSQGSSTGESQGSSAGESHSSLGLIADNHTDGSHASSGDSAGVHRRLAGGGNYHSYEECLEKSCEADIRTQCQLTPDVFTLIGHAGVALMIFESGMHFDFEKAKIVGPWACVVAVFGTFTPLVTGSLLTMAYGYGFFPEGVSAGTALAPTSVGIALRLLGEAGVLQENFGQAIITAAFVDDILSLILFNVLFSLGGDFDIISVVVYPIVGVVFMAIGMYGAMAFWPRFLDGWLLKKLPVQEGKKVPYSDEALFLIMMIVLCVYGTITHFLGTHLWGCFIAGMSFACLSPPHHAHHVWSKQTKRVTSWMIRIFFACTVAFSIPLDKLMSLDAFWKGSIMGIGPCILTKVCCGPFMGKEKWVIGWAMVGRAEFAYLIAQMAAAADMLSSEMFSIVIWALLYATIFAPFIFRMVLNRYIAAEGLAGKSDEHGHDELDDEEALPPQESRPPQDEAGVAANEDYKKRMIDLEDIKVQALDRDASPVSPATYGGKGEAGEAGKCCVPFSRGMM